MQQTWRYLHYQSLESIKASRPPSGLSPGLEPHFMCFFSRKTTQVVNRSGSTNSGSVYPGFCLSWWCFEATGPLKLLLWETATRCHWQMPVWCAYHAVWNVEAQSSCWGGVCMHVYVYACMYVCLCLLHADENIGAPALRGKNTFKSGFLTNALRKWPSQQNSKRPPSAGNVLCILSPCQRALQPHWGK